MGKQWSVMEPRPKPSSYCESRALPVQRETACSTAASDCQLSPSVQENPLRGRLISQTTPKNCAACTLVHPRKTFRETSCSILILGFLQVMGSGGSRRHHRRPHHPMCPLPFDSCLLNPPSSIYTKTWNSPVTSQFLSRDPHVCILAGSYFSLWEKEKLKISDIILLGSK